MEPPDPESSGDPYRSPASSSPTPRLPRVCPNCGLVSPSLSWCCDCGFSFEEKAMSPSYTRERLRMTSGRGADAVVPHQIQRWNWGAFFLTFIWGLRHRVYSSLFVFVPFVGLFVPILLGLNGNELAWRAVRWNSIEEFLRVQRSWSKWGIGLFVAGIFLGAICLVMYKS
jgi:hypothetical protein